MAHRQQIEFCLSVKKKFPQFFSNRLIIDIGSLDINGNNQYLFENSLYFGIDLLPGKNVDFAVKGNDFNLPDASVDVVISTECFEHDQFYSLTLKNIVRMLKPGGLFMFSCATTGRPEHGTRRTTPEDAPFIQEIGEWGDYYKNLEELDIRLVLDIESIFEQYEFSTDLETHDLYFWGIKKGKLIDREDYSFQLKKSAESIRISNLKQIVAKRHKHIVNLKQIIAERDRQIVNFDHATAKYERQIINLNQIAAERDRQIVNFGHATAEYERQIINLNQITAERDKQIVNLNQAIIELNIKLAKLITSNSWRFTKPLRFLGRLLRGEFDQVKQLLLTYIPKKLTNLGSNTRLRSLIGNAYHRLPLPQSVKWRLRERLHPILTALHESPTLTGLTKGAVKTLRSKANDSVLIRDNGREHALAQIMQFMAQHTQLYGPVSHWITLPFLATGGAEMVALHLCQALRVLRSNHSVALLITDRNLVNEQMVIPEGVFLVVFDNYLFGDLSYERKRALLRDLLLAGKPECFHNINSEVAWHLIMIEGERLKRFTKLYASIFAFQFTRDGQKKIGYAAYFLQKSLPHLAGLHSDNRRFIEDAIEEYKLSEAEQLRMVVVYQPCRLLNEPKFDRLGIERIAQRRLRLSALPLEGGKRPQILWAGRLDSEKRVDLLLEIVNRCQFADFRIFGQMVLEDEVTLPSLSNLTYEGPFSSPLEWLERYDFDALIFTSRWEGMPNILIEAGVLGISIIAPTVGGIGELVSDQTGYPLGEKPSVEDYEEALQLVITKPADALIRAEKMLELILQRHSWKSYVTTIASLPDYVSKTPPVHNLESASLYGAALPVHTKQTYSKPLVSVVIPCYNQARYLYETISSALVACSHPLEIIVVDDGSTDKRTMQHLAEVEKLAPGIVRIHRQTNQGLSAARNSGISLARGNFIQLLDADDILVPDKINAQVAQLQVNPKLDASVCNFLLCDESRNDYSKSDEAIARFELSLEDFLYRWERGFVIPIHCGLFRRQIFNKVQFDVEIQAKEDWLFWTSLSMTGAQFGYIHGHWSVYRQHDDSMRRSYMKMGQAWLQVGLKINTMLKNKEPLFFESVVAWFEQCYYANRYYKEELAALQEKVSSHNSTTVVAKNEEINITSDSTLSSHVIDSEKLVNRLKVISQTSQPPLISVIVPVYGHYEYLEACLGSIAEQGNDVSIEIICVDDASPDPRVTHLMNALSNKLERLKIILKKINCGISNSQNTAVSLANGEYLAFLDCDDMLEPHALSLIRDQIIIRPDIDYFFTDRIDVDKNNNPLCTIRYGGYSNLHFTTHEKIPFDLLDGMVASHLKVIKRDTYQKVGGCDPEISGVQDWDLALKIANNGKIHYVNQALYRHRIHHGSVTSSDLVAQFRKTNIVRRNYCHRLLRNIENPDSDQLVKCFSKADIPIELSVLKDYWKRGYHCVIDIAGVPTISQINFIREFNSYFDRIKWDDPSVPSSLVGYLWDPNLIKSNPSSSLSHLPNTFLEKGPATMAGENIYR